MSRLNDEQIEAVLSGEMDEPTELDPASRARLSEAAAIRKRVRGALASAAPDAAFADRLRAQLSAGTEAEVASADATVSPRTASRHFWRSFLPVAAAAALILLTIPLFYLLRPGEVSAQQEMAELHASHESPTAALVRGERPARLAAELADHLGFKPPALHLSASERLRGGCIDHLRGRKAVSYVLETPHGIVSVIVATTAPAEMRLSRKRMQDGRVVWLCQHDCCNMAGVQVRQLSYYAVACAPHEYLAELVLRVVPQK